MQAWWRSGHDPNPYPKDRAVSLGQTEVTQTRQVAGLERSGPWPYVGWIAGTSGDWWAFMH